MTDTLRGIQITHRCAGLINATSALCGEPAPYLINSMSLCHDHALALARAMTRGI